MNKLPERIRIKDIARLANVSVGTVDRVLHGRSGVSHKSQQRVEEVLKELDYQPNMYASALASNKKYKLVCLLPQYQVGGYWSAVENGIAKAVAAFSDFNIGIATLFYDQFDSNSFLEAGEKVLLEEPDGVLLAPTTPHTTAQLTQRFKEQEIAFVFIDSNIPDLDPLAFFGQNAQQSGYFAARMAMILGLNATEIVIFRQLYQGLLASNQQATREVGFRNYMKEHFPKCLIHELDFYAKRPEEDEAILEKFFEEHPEVHCGITFNSKVYEIGEYLEKHNKLNFKLVGYDLLERNVAC
ncbi:MAG: LacI family DNA-binding transcriptional regulator, partial [Phocaeicola sp.]